MPNKINGKKKRVPETPEHKAAKLSLCNFFKQTYGLALTEFIDNGFETDVSAILFPPSKIMVEVIWSPSKQNFFRDMNLVLCSDAAIKVVVANPKIFENQELTRYFDRIKMAEATKGYSYIGLIPWDFDKISDSLQRIKTEIDKIIESRGEKLQGTLKRLKEAIFNEKIPLPAVLSECLGLTNELGLKNEGEWLKCELYGYYDYGKGEFASYKSFPGEPTYRSIKGRITLDFGYGNIIEHDYPLLIAQPINEIIAWTTSHPPGVEDFLMKISPSDIRQALAKSGIKMPNDEVYVKVSLLMLNQITVRLRTAVHKLLESIESKTRIKKVDKA
jgi:hypothetical protein